MRYICFLFVPNQNLVQTIRHVNPCLEKSTLTDLIAETKPSKGSEGLTRTLMQLRIFSFEQNATNHGSSELEHENKYPYFL